MCALAFIVACYTMFDCCPWKTCSFLKGNRGPVDLGEKGGEQGVGGEEGGEAVVRMYCMREESIFNFLNEEKRNYCLHLLSIPIIF